MSEEKKASVQSLERALNLIDILANYGEGISLKELSELSKLNKSTVYRLLRTLSDFQYVYQDEESDKYRMGIKILSLSNSFLKNIDIRDTAKPFLRELCSKTGNTAQLSIECDNRVVFIDKVSNKDRMIQMMSQIGRGLPMHCSACGKVLLAWKSIADIRSILGPEPLKAYTNKTIIKFDELIDHLEEVKKQGFATDWYEHEENIYCLAAPVFDIENRVVAAVSLAGASFEFDPNKYKAYCQAVIETTKKISEKIGHQNNSEK